MHCPPEEFLWHTFHGLAQAALVMGQGPFRDLKTNKPTKHRLLHLDIKPANGKRRVPETDEQHVAYNLISDVGL
jgi:hypothetical protein